MTKESLLLACGRAGLPDKAMAHIEAYAPQIVAAHPQAVIDTEVLAEMRAAEEQKKAEDAARAKADAEAQAVADAEQRPSVDADAVAKAKATATAAGEGIANG